VLHFLHHLQVFRLVLVQELKGVIFEFVQKRNLFLGRFLHRSPVLDFFQVVAVSLFQFSPQIAVPLLQLLVFQG